MHRLLIVDDERHVVNWLADLFATLEEPELDIYKAVCGEEALAVLASASIDVVLMDCRMPGMSGLELLARIRKRWVDRRVVFLSGYKDFDAMYRAGASGAVRYLLKTEDDEVIVRTVVEAVRSIERERAEAAILDRSRFAEGLLEYLERSDALRESLKAGTSEPGQPLSSSRPVVLGLGVRDPGNPAVDGTELLKLRYSLDLLSGRCFAGHARVAVSESPDGGLLWIIQELAADAPDHVPLPAVSFLCQLFEELQVAAMHSIGVGLSFVLHDCPVPWGEAWRVSKTLRDRALHRTPECPDTASVITFAPAGSPGECVSDQALVGRIRRFVDANIDGDLTLTNLSRNLYYNPSYISRVFKRATGRNFTDFVGEARIRKAAGLLMETENHIQDIARACGFDSPQYFSTVFRKTWGCTPHAFRDRERLKKQGIERKYKL